MRFGSVCSGIEAASVAWHPLGWETAFVSEIEPFPSAVLAHRLPSVPNLGDMTKFDTWGLDRGSIDLLVGGTPCQSFSVAGLRKGLDDSRGNLALVYARMVDHFRPRWAVWENVPGVLSSNGGRDFGSILGALDELGYGYAWRVLDAQYFGVPQRRRRVFLVASSRGWRSAAAVLFERESLRGNPPPRRRPREDAPGAADGGAPFRGRWWDGGDVSQTLDAVLAKGQTMPEKNRFPAVLVPDTAHTLRGEGFDASEEGTGRGTPIVPVLPFDTTQITSAKNYSRPRPGDPCHPLAAGAHAPAIAFNARQDPDSWVDRTGPIDTDGATQAVAFSGSLAVRRLTPRECERLQGFPDDWTRIAWKGKDPELCPDGPRYKACGNSMAVPVMRWIGSRIQMLEEILA